MPSFTTSLRLEKQVDGSNENIWGQILNRQFDLIDDAISGVHNVTLAGADVTLGTNDGDVDHARNMMLRLTGTLTENVNVIIPEASKVYIVLNDTTGAYTATIKTTAESGEGAEIPQGTIQLVACDGTDCDTLTPESVATAENALQLGGAVAALYARKDQGLPTDQIFTKSQGTEKVTLTISGGSIAIDASTSNCFKVLLNADATLANPTGSPVDGQTIRIVMKQDGTGERTVEFASSYKFPGGVAPTVTATANAIDYLGFEYDADSGFWLGNILQDLK